MFGQSFLGKIETHLVSDDYMVRQFVLDILDSSFIGTENTFMLGLEANEKNRRDRDSSEHLTYLKHLPMPEEGMRHLLLALRQENLPSDQADGYIRLLNHADPCLAQKLKEDLSAVLKEKGLNVKNMSFYTDLCSDPNDVISQKLQYVIKNLETSKSFKKDVYLLGKQIMEMIARRGFHGPNELLNSIRKMRKKPTLSFQDLYYLVLAGQMETEVVVPDMVALVPIHKSNEQFLEEFADAMVKIGTNRVVDAVLPLLDDNEVRFHAIDIIGKIKTDYAQRVLLEEFSRETRVDSKTLIAACLCEQLSAQAIPMIESFIEEGYEKRLLTLEGPLYCNCLINGINHPKLQQWKEIAGHEGYSSEPEPEADLDSVDLPSNEEDVAIEVASEPSQSDIQEEKIETKEAPDQKKPEKKKKSYLELLLEAESKSTSRLAFEEEPKVQEESYSIELEPQDLEDQADTDVQSELVKELASEEEAQAEEVEFGSEASFDEEEQPQEVDLESEASSDEEEQPQEIEFESEASSDEEEQLQEVELEIEASSDEEEQPSEVELEIEPSSAEEEEPLDIQLESEVRPDDMEDEESTGIQSDEVETKDEEVIHTQTAHQEEVQEPTMGDNPEDEMESQLENDPILEEKDEDLEDEKSETEVSTEDSNSELELRDEGITLSEATQQNLDPVAEDAPLNKKEEIESKSSNDQIWVEKKGDEQEEKQDSISTDDSIPPLTTEWESAEHGELDQSETASSLETVTPSDEKKPKPATQPEQTPVSYEEIKAAVERLYRAGEQSQTRRKQVKVGRNDPCPCGSGKKYKKCCM
ncbi:hypothetical protein CR194_13685 [Salipaludibacillus keqinensis]|uniref:SEC-C motif-containing protein n=1 Tax=Salipaludibacillus keqinensis TaxID=2045207 RepID=A0A323TJ35_9BACI|nr:hypothetical protein CR194_13685 [Salipaludibacillus keqinensis]